MPERAGYSSESGPPVSSGWVCSSGRTPLLAQRGPGRTRPRALSPLAPRTLPYALTLARRALSRGAVVSSRVSRCLLALATARHAGDLPASTAIAAFLFRHQFNSHGGRVGHGRLWLHVAPSDPHRFLTALPRVKATRRNWPITGTNFLSEEAISVRLLMRSASPNGMPQNVIRR